MIPNDLKKRTRFVKATPLKDRASIKKFSRKETAYVQEEQPEYAETFDNFFDYEEDLADMKPAGELFADSILGRDEDAAPSFVEMESVSNNNEKMLISPIVMEPLPDGEDKSFKQCLFMITEERRCKRQAPKHNDLCSAHRKR